MNKYVVSHIKDIMLFRDSLCLISHVDNETEIMKIWARWIITHRSLFPQKSLYIPDDREYDPQLLVELIEKGVSTLHANYLHDWMVTQAQSINKRFPWYSADMEFGGLHGDVPISIVYTDRDVTLTCDGLEAVVPQQIYTKLSRRIKEFHSTNYIWFTCLMYSLLDGKGLQWAVPCQVMNILRHRLKCDTELFASPINNFFGKYYSLFPFDKVFGSLGNFFAAPDSHFLTGTYQVNPPFIDCLFTKTTQRILKLLRIADENNRDLTFIYIMPHWEDFVTYNLVVESQYCVKQINLRPNNHYYYQHITNNYIRARFGTSVIFLSTNAHCCDSGTEFDIISAFSRYPSYRKN